MRVQLRGPIQVTSANEGWDQDSGWRGLTETTVEVYNETALHWIAKRTETQGGLAQRSGANIVGGLWNSMELLQL